MRMLIVALSALVATASALYSSSDDVVELTPNNFDRLVKQSGDLWFVEFYAPWCGHCKSLAPEWKKAATALKGIVNIGAVDADAHNSLGGQFGIRGFPTIKVFAGDKPEDYNGQRTAQGIIDTAFSKLRSLVKDRLAGKKTGGGGGGSRGGSGGGGGGGGKKASGDDVVVVTDSNFEDEVLNADEMVLVEFYAPWCGHCKNLEPQWASAASELKGKVKLCKVDATVETVAAGRFSIQGYPTIKYFPAGRKSYDDAEEYDGGRSSGDIVSWALDKHSANLPPPEVKELLDEAGLKAACEDNQLCLIAVLPHILDCPADCRTQYIAVLQGMADKYKKKQWGWLWTEAFAHQALEEAVGIGGFGYPAMAAVNQRKMKYAWLRGSFSQAGIGEFLRELSLGRGSTAPVGGGKMPAISARDAWDGKDGEMPEEEEIDLSDVDFDDIEKDEL